MCEYLLAELDQVEEVVALSDQTGSAMPPGTITKSGKNTTLGGEFLDRQSDVGGQ